MMKRNRFAVLAAVLMFAAAPVQAQVVPNPLLVGNQQAFNALDLYNGNTGAYVGPFAGAATGPPGAFFFTHGPTGNVFVRLNTNPASPIQQFDGTTGNFLGNFVNTAGENFTFGPDGNLYQIEGTAGSQSQSVRRYNGSNGQLIGTFVGPTLDIGGRLRFGPGGDLYVQDGSSIRRFDGTTGAPEGTLIQQGAANPIDFLFTGDGRLIASDTITGNVLQFDALTGSFIGTLAQGNGLNGPFGLAVGSDGALYVASTLGGGNIKRFDLTSGAFLGDLVTSTAHSAPTFIEFSPNPIPEPSSCILLGIVASVWSLRPAFRRREMTVNAKLQ